MNDSRNIEFAIFGQSVIELLDNRGWHSVPKREMTIHLLHLANQAGLIDIAQPRFSLASRLMISTATLDGLLRDRALLHKEVAQYDDQQFADWLRGNNQTGDQDSKSGYLVIGVNSISERMSVEGYLEMLGVVPDYKNNRQLMVFDLTRLVSSLARISHESPVDLLRAFEVDATTGSKKRRDAEGEIKSLIQLGIGAMKEQAGKRIGDKTVEFAISLINVARRKLKKVVI